MIISKKKLSHTLAQLYQTDCESKAVTIFMNILLFLVELSIVVPTEIADLNRRPAQSPYKSNKVAKRVVPKNLAPLASSKVESDGRDSKKMLSEEHSQPVYVTANAKQTTNPATAVNSNSLEVSKDLFAVEKKKQARVEIEKSIELLAPAVAKREEVMRNVVDSARARIAARKKTSAQRLSVAAVGAGEGRQHDQMEE